MTFSRSTLCNDSANNGTIEFTDGVFCYPDVAGETCVRNTIIFNADLSVSTAIITTSGGNTTSQTEEGTYSYVDGSDNEVRICFDLACYTAVYEFSGDNLILLYTDPNTGCTRDVTYARV